MNQSKIKLSGNYTVETSVADKYRSQLSPDGSLVALIVGPKQKAAGVPSTSCFNSANAKFSTCLLFFDATGKSDAVEVYLPTLIGNKPIVGYLSIVDMAFSSSGESLYLVIDHDGTKHLIRYNINSASVDTIIDGNTSTNLDVYSATLPIERSLYIDAVSENDGFLLGTLIEDKTIREDYHVETVKIVKINITTGELTVLASNRFRAGGNIIIGSRPLKGIWINDDGSKSMYFEDSQRKTPVNARTRHIVSVSANGKKNLGCVGKFASYSNKFSNARSSLDGKTIVFGIPKSTSSGTDSAITDVGVMNVKNGKCTLVSDVTSYLHNYEPSISSDGRVMNYVRSKRKPLSSEYISSVLYKMKTNDL